MIAVADEVRAALAARQPVVALESTVLAHGLPAPRNLQVAASLEASLRAEGVVPATIAVLDGTPRIGLTDDDLERVCAGVGFQKLSTRDLPAALARRENGATTVAATMFLAAAAGIDAFATGGIGGVHRGDAADVSADLTELERTRQIVVCAGAKAILDLPATREALETRGILVAGWGTGELPAFYSARSGLSVDVRVEDEQQVAALWRAKAELDTPGAILLCVPPPAERSLPPERIDAYLAEALASASKVGITGKALTPYLLSQLVRLSGGDTLETNIALLMNNVRVAARVAKAVASS